VADATGVSAISAAFEFKICGAVIYIERRSRTAWRKKDRRTRGGRIGMELIRLFKKGREMKEPARGHASGSGECEGQ